MYQNPGPVKFEKLSIKIVPEDSSRVAAMLGGRFDYTHQFPLQFINQAMKTPSLQVQQANPNYQLMYYGMRITRPLMSDKRVREAMNIAINRSEITKAILLGNAEPAYTYIVKGAKDYSVSSEGIIKEDLNRAKKLLDEAGWKPGPDGIRVKDGQRLAPVVFIPQVSYFPRVSEAIQGYMRKIGIDWQIQAWDSTILPSKLASPDFDLWTVTVPYMSAGELMNFYFDGKNIPVPNRMNYNDAEVNEWLKQGRSNMVDADRARLYDNVQKKVTTEHLWIPVMTVNMYTVTNKKLKGARPHMLFQNTFYKGLDLSY